jgi:hypothetical protein
MNALVIADADDPSAWGEPIEVPPSKSPRPAWIARAKHLELAAKYYVLSVLHRLGTDAALAVPQSNDVDIVIAKESGSPLTIDVKALSGLREWRVVPIRARERHYIVFVWYPSADDLRVHPKAYVLASEQFEVFLKQRKRDIVSLETLARMAAEEAWQLLSVATAA